MKSKIATTVEQSIKLSELGIDPSTADMHWESVYNDEYRLALSTTKEAVEAVERMQDSLKTTFDVKLVPAWSLSALLSLLPIHISIKKGYFYSLEWQFWNDNSLRYVTPYSDERECLIDIYSDHDEKLKDSVDTAVEMVCYLKENKLI